jgi:hypothetical protein
MELMKSLFFVNRYLLKKQHTGHGDTITPWRVSSNQEDNYKTNVPINATLIGAAATAAATAGATIVVILRSLFGGSIYILRFIYIGWLVNSVIQIPLVLAFTIKHHKKASRINPVVPRTLQFHEDEQDCDNISNEVKDSIAENDGQPIVTHVEVYDHGGSIDKADEDSAKADKNCVTYDNCEIKELSDSNVKLTEIGEASGQLPSQVCLM